MCKIIGLKIVEEDKKLENSVFTSNSIAKSYFKMALPVVMGLVISIVYNITDTYFIARTHDTNLIAGVSICAPVFTLLMAFGNIFGQGGSSLISRLLGKKDTENLHKVSSFCFYAAIIFGVVAGALMLILRNPIISLLGADELVAPHASSYFTWFALGAPLVVLSFIHSNLLRAEGMSTHSMISTVAGSVVNVILDPIFIFTLGLGAAGAAIATILGYVFTDAYGLIIVFLKSKALSVDPRKMKISPKFVGQIFGVGTSAALSNITQSVCLILTNNKLLEYGNDKLAVMGIVQKVSMIVMLVIVGFSFGGAPLIGYHYGSGNKEKLKKLLAFVLKFLVGIAVAMSAIMIIAAPLALKLFINDPSQIEVGTLMLRSQVASMFLMAVILFVTIIFQATGKSLSALVLSLTRQGVIFAIVIFVAAHFLGYNGVIWSQAISDVISAAIALVLLKVEFGGGKLF